MTREGDGFLSRWSRLKREGAAPDLSRPAAPPAAIEEQPSLPEGKSLDELIAELPRIENLVPGQNLGVFMQHWVPAGLRNAALRRMWLLDPAISGYVDPALDYAYDYNTLGAAPGFGPMQTSAAQIREVNEMFDRALGIDAGAEAEPPPGDDDMMAHPAPAASARPAATQHEETPGALANDKTPRTEQTLPAPIARTPPPDQRAAQHGPAGDGLDRPAPRRHGRALPT